MGPRRLIDPYRAFLALPGSRRLLVSSIVARMPAGMTALGLLLLVRDSTGSFATAGFVVGADSFAGAAAAPLLGRLLDRIGPRPVLLPAATGRATLLVALVVAATQGAGAAPLIVLAAAAGFLHPPVSACARAAWPVVARTSATREVAYAVDATTQEVIWTAGPLLVGAVIALASPATAVLLAATITFGGTAWFAASPALARWPRSERARRGTRTRESAALRALLLCGLFVGFSIGAVEVGLPAFAVHEGSRDAAGLLLAFWSAGSLTGGLLYGSLALSVANEARLPVLLAALAACTAPLLAAGSLPAAVGLSALAGFAQAPVFACQYSLIGSLAPTGAVATAFTWSTATLVGGIAAGSALAGILVEHTGVDAAFALALLAAVLAGALAVVTHRITRV